MDKDLYEAIKDLNNSIYGFTGSSEEFYFEVRTNTTSIEVSFAGITIWNYDDDNREFDEQENKYEPYKLFFIREAIKLIENIHKHRSILLKELKKVSK